MFPNPYQPPLVRSLLSLSDPLKVGSGGSFEIFPGGPLGASASTVLTFGVAAGTTALAVVLGVVIIHVGVVAVDSAVVTVTGSAGTSIVVAPGVVTEIVHAELQLFSARR